MAATLAFPTTLVFLSLVITIGFLSHQFHLTIAKPTKGFSLKLIHMHSPESPFYPGNNLSTHDKIQQLFDVSESRFFELQSRITKTVGVVDDPNIIRPKVVQKGKLYHVQIGVGTPYNIYHLVLDTGSPLTWVQCLPREFHFSQRGAAFDPSHSSTYGTLPCHHHFCEDWPCVGGECKYEIGYVRGQKTKGTMSSETFTFPPSDGGHPWPEEIPNMAFGCSTDNRGFDHFNGDGILGMSQAQVSFIGQLYPDLTVKRFSYCLVPPHIRRHTYLRFGSDVTGGGPSYQSTPFVQLRNMYRLSLRGISINDNPIHFGNNPFGLRPNGTGGCVIDTGAAVTAMDTIPYQTFKQAIMQHFAPYQLDTTIIRPFDLCYIIPENFHNINFPRLTFHFQGANLRVMPENTFVVNNQRGYFCLAVKPIDNGPTLIGAIQQQYYRFVYDLTRQKLLFAPDDCSDH